MASEYPHDQRTILRFSGETVRDFLQGLVTNDVTRLDDGLVYAALQTAQGKYLADFFLVPDGADVLIDIAAAQADDFRKRMTMYKLRAKIDITVTDLGVTRGLGDGPEGAFPDPRHAELGWRRYGAGATDMPDTAATLEQRRIALGVPAAGIELIPNDTYILEAGFEALHGVDFRKGCFVGQEIVARMHHKTDLRKGFQRVLVDGHAPVGTDILRDGKTVGALFSQSDGHGIAYLRHDRVGPGMIAGDAKVTLPA